MSYIPLIEHTRPRVLMIDFAAGDVQKVQQAGFEARRGATGVLENDCGQFLFPYAVQDVEVIFAQVTPLCFAAAEARKPHENSVENEPFFKDLFREVWEKNGWAVLFIAQGTQPNEFWHIGIERLGVIAQGRDHMPESVRGLLVEARQEQNPRHYHEEVGFPLPQMPRSTGHGVRVADSDLGQVLRRHLKTSLRSALTCLKHPFAFMPIREPQPHVGVFGQVEGITSLITDESADTNVLALEVAHKSHAGQQDGKNVYHQGGILLLPDFGPNNANVALALLQEVIPGLSPHLFDSPSHPWLEKYQPVPVQKLQAQRQDVLEAARLAIEELDANIEAEREEFSWLLGLLASAGDDFERGAALALRFLGFEVEEVDDNLAPGERKREDLRLRDASSGFFALGEAKTGSKGRGASEDFISKTQTHQARYSREEKVPVPFALLIANIALDLDPVQRQGRFYAPEVAGRLEESGITAISSVALFYLCQWVLEERVSKEQARDFLTAGRPIINAIEIEEVTQGAPQEKPK